MMFSKEKLSDAIERVGGLPTGHSNILFVGIDERGITGGARVTLLKDHVSADLLFERPKDGGGKVNYGGQVLASW